MMQLLVLCCPLLTHAQAHSGSHQAQVIGSRLLSAPRLSLAYPQCTAIVKLVLGQLAVVGKTDGTKNPPGPKGGSSGRPRCDSVRVRRIQLHQPIPTSQGTEQQG